MKYAPIIDTILFTSVP